MWLLRKPQNHMRCAYAISVRAQEKRAQALTPLSTLCNQKAERNLGTTFVSISIRARCSQSFLWCIMSFWKSSAKWNNLFIMLSLREVQLKAKKITRENQWTDQHEMLLIYRFLSNPPKQSLQLSSCHYANRLRAECWLPMWRGSIQNLSLDYLN